jgi:uncharacterized repeat protein (TIGR03803 family)
MIMAGRLQQVDRSRERPRITLLVFAVVIGIVVLVGPAAPAQHFRVLHFFGGGRDGAMPLSTLVRDSSGNLYGTTQLGGASFCPYLDTGCGTVFKLDVKGRITILHTFAGVPDGADPSTGMIRDQQGNFYGTTFYGGTFNAGTVFKMDPKGRLRVLHSFTWTNGDGAFPSGGLVMDRDGSLYGTTQEGGRDDYCWGDCGTVFKIDKTGKETVLLGFILPSAYPTASMIWDAEGHLYGTTSGNGSSSFGTVFEVNDSGPATILYRFSGGEDGGVPDGNLVRDASGHFYGTTLSFGKWHRGVVFELTADGEEKVLYSFKGQPDGESPFAGLVRDEESNLYGVSLGGGTANRGTIFKLDKARKMTLLHSFVGPDGINPYGGLLRDTAGNLYGTTEFGGDPACILLPGGCGVVFELSP